MSKVAAKTAVGPKRTKEPYRQPVDPDAELRQELAATRLNLRQANRRVHQLSFGLPLVFTSLLAMIGLWLFHHCDPGAFWAVSRWVGALGSWFFAIIALASGVGALGGDRPTADTGPM